MISAKEWSYLLLFYIFYLVFGAVIFQTTEQEHEINEMIHLRRAQKRLTLATELIEDTVIRVEVRRAIENLEKIFSKQLIFPDPVKDLIIGHVVTLEKGIKIEELNEYIVKMNASLKDDKNDSKKSNNNNDTKKYLKNDSSKINTNNDIRNLRTVRGIIKLDDLEVSTPVNEELTQLSKKADSDIINKNLRNVNDVVNLSLKNHSSDSNFSSNSNNNSINISNISSIYTLYYELGIEDKLTNNNNNDNTRINDSSTIQDLAIKIIDTKNKVDRSVIENVGKKELQKKDENKSKRNQEAINNSELHKKENKKSSAKRDVNIFTKEDMLRKLFINLNTGGYNDSTILEALLNFSDYSHDHEKKIINDGLWNFWNSFFYSFITITTIGFGNMSPKTQMGQIFCILYCIFGVPYNGIVFTNLADLFAKKFLSKTDKERYKNRLRIVLDAVLYLIPGIVIFLALPAYLFSLAENWTFIASFYYAFITLTTIGFGDYVAGYSARVAAEWLWIYRFGIQLWILFGLGYLLMVVIFIQKALQSKHVRSLEAKLKSVIAKKKKTRFTVLKDLEKLGSILKTISLMGSSNSPASETRKPQNQSNGNLSSWHKRRQSAITAPNLTSDSEDFCGDHKCNLRQYNSCRGRLCRNEAKVQNNCDTFEKKSEIYSLNRQNAFDKGDTFEKNFKSHNMNRENNSDNNNDSSNRVFGQGVNISNIDGIHDKKENYEFINSKSGKRGNISDWNNSFDKLYGKIDRNIGNENTKGCFDVYDTKYEICSEKICDTENKRGKPHFYLNNFDDDENDHSNEFSEKKKNYVSSNNFEKQKTPLHIVKSLRVLMHLADTVLPEDSTRRTRNCSLESNESQLEETEEEEDWPQMSIARKISFWTINALPVTVNRLIDRTYADQKAGDLEQNPENSNRKLKEQLRSSVEEICEPSKSPKVNDLSDFFSIVDNLLNKR